MKRKGNSPEVHKALEELGAWYDSMSDAEHREHFLGKPDMIETEQFQLRHPVYHLPGGKKVMVGPRPDMYDISGMWEVFISVTGKHIPLDHVNSARYDAKQLWFPWDERTAPPPPHVLYGVLRTMDHEFKRGVTNIYFHCDLGSHRSPTVFGAYLRVYHPEEAESIVAKARAEFEKNYKEPGDRLSDPLHYWETYTRPYPFLTDWVKKIPETEDLERLDFYAVKEKW